MQRIICLKVVADNGDEILGTTVARGIIGERVGGATVAPRDRGNFVYKAPVSLQQ